MQTNWKKKVTGSLVAVVATAVTFFKKKRELS